MKESLVAKYEVLIRDCPRGFEQNGEILRHGDDLRARTAEWETNH
jgi:hypothetical protein